MSFDIKGAMNDAWEMGREYERKMRQESDIKEMEKRIMDRIDVLEDRLSTKWEK